MLRRSLLAAFLTALTAVSAVAQVPTTLPANSVLGRMGVGPGKPQAIPFATLFSGANVQPVTSNLTALLAMGVGCAGHSGASAWTPRTITGTASEIVVANGNCLAGDPTISLATITQPYTGAVARTLRDKVRDVVNVADFGAAGDGSDESTKVQAAIDAMAALANGGKVVFNCKTYTTGATTIQVKRGVSLEGCYGGQLIIESDDVPSTTIRRTGGTGPIFLLPNRYFGRIENFQLNGGGIAQAGIQIIGSQRSTFRNINIYFIAAGAANGFDATGIYLTTDGATYPGGAQYRSTGNRFENVSVNHIASGVNGMTWKGTDLASVDCASVTDNTVTGSNFISGTNGIALNILECTDTNTFHGTFFQTSGASGVGVYINHNASNNQTYGNQFYGGAIVNSDNLNLGALITARNNFGPNRFYGVWPYNHDRTIGFTNIGGANIVFDGADNVSKVDDTTTNATTYPLLSPTTSGYDEAKVSSSKLTFNPSTGLLTAAQLQSTINGSTVGASSPASGKFTTLEATSSVKFDGMTTPGCLSNDASGNISGGNACSGGGMPVGGSIGQAPLNSAAGTALWRTQPFTNISALTGADCTGAVATAISTVIGSVKSIALPTDCLLKVAANDTIPAGVFFAIPCGAQIRVDGAAVLTFNADTDDNTCQKFSASGALSGTGGGVVKGLRFNRPEWWGAFGDCNYAGACTHDDSGPLQQTFNSAQNSGPSSGGQRAQVKLGCGKGYGVSTGIVATASRTAPLLISGCGPLSGGNSEAGSSIYGRTGFTGVALAVTGNTTTNIEIRDFEISSIDQFGTDVCLQVGTAGNTLSNASGHSLAQNLRLSYCRHLLKFGGSVVSFQFDRIWMVMGNNGAVSGANASCIEAIPNSEVLSELTFNAIACDGSTNSAATAICLNFHSQGTGGISGTRINDVSCYAPTNGLVIKAEGTSSIPDFWCYSCQMDAMRAGSVGYILTTTGTATIADVVLDKTYITNTGAPDAGINIDGSAGGTIKNIGIHGAYMATGGTLRGIRVTDAAGVQVQGARIGGTYVNQGILLNNCTGCLANNNIFAGTVPNFVLLGGTTDYSQACNNTASGALAPAAVSGSVSTGVHNIYYGSSFQTCPNN